MGNVIRIGIDAGHGSKTAGKRTAPFTKNVDIDGDGTIDIKKGEQYREHYANVMVADKLVSELKRCKLFKVTIAGFDDEDAKDDEDTALSARQTIFKSAGCEITVSIHFNAFGDGKSFNSAEGVGIYIHDKYPEQSKELATVVLNHLIKGTKQKNRGVNSQALALCNCKTMKTKASILCELAFMTNEREAHELMANEDFCQEAAEEIAKGICEYTKVSYVEASKASTSKLIYRVQTGAFSVYKNATAYCEEVKKAGFKDAYVKYSAGLYKVQIGAYSVKGNANNMLSKIKKAGFPAFITTN